MPSAGTSTLVSQAAYRELYTRSTITPKPAMEPRTLPGFFWDPLKKKYFKIQPNHIAPDSRYSAGAIEDSKLELQTLQEEEKKRIKARRQLLKHDYRIHDPRTTLQYQLGGHGPGSTTSVVAEYYGASISSRRVLQEASIPQFALDPKSGILFTATWDNGHPESSVTNLVSLGQDADDQGNWTWRTPGRRMNRLPSRIASLMVTNGVLAWVEEPGKSTAESSFASCRKMEFWEVRGHPR